MSESKFIFDTAGIHNSNLEEASKRLARQGVYKDLSTIIVVPTYKDIPAVIVNSWWSMMTPPNQKVFRLFAQGQEVGAAYSSAIELILGNPDLASFKYILMLEHDNAPQCDGLIRLLEKMEAHPEYSAIGGLYWTKGESGVPQIWGNPKQMPLNFQPQAPVPGQLVECNGTGMGFTVFRTELFKDPKLRRPWFKTDASFDPMKGASVFTQDLWFYMDARKYGYRCAVDCGTLVGHYDASTGIMW